MGPDPDGTSSTHELGVSCLDHLDACDLSITQAHVEQFVRARHSNISTLSGELNGRRVRSKPKRHAVRASPYL